MCKKDWYYSRFFALSGLFQVSIYPAIYSWIHEDTFCACLPNSNIVVHKLIFMSHNWRKVGKHNLSDTFLLQLKLPTYNVLNYCNDIQITTEDIFFKI